ncbi:MAG: putative peptidoglycan glycosyltransferase FtsW [Myxococcota bacterium]
MNANAQRRPTAGLDTGISISSLILILMGVVMSYSATAALDLETKLPPLFFDHVTGLMMGLALGVLGYWTPPVVLRRLALPVWCGVVALLVVTLAVGTEVNGAQRWLVVPGLGFRFQPGELAKCVTLIAVADWLARRQDRRELTTRRTLQAAALALIPAGLLVLQPDLGNAVVLVALTALLLFIAGTPLPRFVVPGIAGVALVSIYIYFNPYARRRVIGFLDPFEDSQGAGWQLVQSFLGFGQGGLLGQGLGNSRQKLAYLPEAHTDFVLSLVAEELGLLGVLVVIGAFAALWIAGTRVARRARDKFDMLCGFAMVALLSIPAFLNASVVMGLVPTKGLTLPFLSYGRTSLVVSCFTLGILLGVARRHPARPAPKPREARWAAAG